MSRFSPSLGKANGSQTSRDFNSKSAPVIIVNPHGGGSARGPRRDNIVRDAAQYRRVKQSNEQNVNGPSTELASPRHHQASNGAESNDNDPSGGRRSSRRPFSDTGEGRGGATAKVVEGTSVQISFSIPFLGSLPLDETIVKRKSKTSILSHCRKSLGLNEDVELELYELVRLRRTDLSRDPLDDAKPVVCMVTNGDSKRGMQMNMQHVKEVFYTQREQAQLLKETGASLVTLSIELAKSQAKQHDLQQQTTRYMKAAETLEEGARHLRHRRSYWKRKYKKELQRRRGIEDVYNRLQKAAASSSRAAAAFGVGSTRTRSRGESFSSDSEPQKKSSSSPSSPTPVGAEATKSTTTKKPTAEATTTTSSSSLSSTPPTAKAKVVGFGDDDVDDVDDVDVKQEEPGKKKKRKGDGSKKSFVRSHSATHLDRHRVTRSKLDIPQEDERDILSDEGGSSRKNTPNSRRAAKAKSTPAATPKASRLHQSHDGEGGGSGDDGGGNGGGVRFEVTHVADGDSTTESETDSGSDDSDASVTDATDNGGVFRVASITDDEADHACVDDERVMTDTHHLRTSQNDVDVTSRPIDREDVPPSVSAEQVERRRMPLPLGVSDHEEERDSLPKPDMNLELGDVKPADGPSSAPSASIRRSASMSPPPGLEHSASHDPAPANLMTGVGSANTSFLSPRGRNNVVYSKKRFATVGASSMCSPRGRSAGSSLKDELGGGRNSGDGKKQENIALTQLRECRLCECSTFNPSPTANWVCVNCKHTLVKHTAISSESR